jgi:glycosyltransferase involved in cell wall biosynthesis
MKRKTVALYSPYLDTLGGGEKHVLAILEVLCREQGYTPVIFWHEDLTKQIENKLAISFPVKPVFQTPPFIGKGSVSTKLQALKQIDIFLYVTDGSYFFSSAKRNYVFCMVPQKNLYSRNLFNIIKTVNYSYISNSLFTHNWLKKWGIYNTVLYPYISKEFIYMAQKPQPKEKIILNVGRFFPSLHSKRQDLAIQAFQKLTAHKQFAGYKLVLAGSVLPADQAYIDKLQEMASGSRAIEIVINPDYKTLLGYYKRAEYYWHFAGYGIDSDLSPELVEHLGITPVEAMAAGCLTFCYNAGGPKELIHQEQNGLLFDSTDDLLKQMENLHTNIELKKQIVLKGQNFTRTNFSYDRFKQNVIDIFIKEV